MAKKRKVNKAFEIREYAKNHPEQGPTEMATALNETMKLGVTSQQVSTTLSNERKKNGIKPKRKSAKRKKVSSTKTATPSYDELKLAKQLADQLGGVTQAKKTLDALSTLSTK